MTPLTNSLLLNHFPSSFKKSLHLQTTYFWYFDSWVLTILEIAKKLFKRGKLIKGSIFSCHLVCISRHISSSRKDKAKSHINIFHKWVENKSLNNHVLHNYELWICKQTWRDYLMCRTLNHVTNNLYVSKSYLNIL